MDESFVYVLCIVTTFTFIFKIQEVIVCFDICNSSNYAWSLLLTKFVRLVNWLKFTNMIICMGFFAPHHDAWFSAKHDWNTNKNKNDQHFRNLLLATEEEHVCAWITDYKFLVSTS